MAQHELKAQLLAVLFAAGRPVSLGELRSLAPEETLLRALAALEGELREGQMGVELERVAGGWRLVVHPRHLEAVEQVLRPTPPRLSKAALEVLALIAYRQPLTRSELEALRGRSVEGVLEGLLERGLVRVVGEKEAVGRPKLYGTTERFLEVFGLESLDDLPPLGEGPVLLLRG
ncbi:Segregation and condensation protein B [Meiothermus luteus]|jgi:segregation and condensation protein B|uniref:Segregation and condensation protein B n=1 Tax=Meiothermus luteus TaxID=2026184 RepID=A0A399EFV5_9DEIN|nr:SMC-Scp complex subunit ScpB [Meiothermus luteus]RIH81940.1 Segregation and condensation protein B [Meiothermus luteus]RMH58307.1 MAG: SMC-Scp complex subunit ScpB [Deinococcota bacterium]